MVKRGQQAAKSGQKGYPKGVYFKEKCHVALPAKVSKNDGGLSEIEGSGSSKPTFLSLEGHRNRSKTETGLLIGLGVIFQ